MILSAHQLHYLPWLRYFHKIALSDTFVVLDNIQFNKNGWQNRNKIKTPQGTALLSVPVFQKFQQLLSDVKIDTRQPWARKHWGALQSNYRRAAHFKDHENFFRGVYERKWERLNDLNDEILSYLLKVLGLRTKVLRSSELSVKGEGTERLVAIVKMLGADTYLSGSYAAEAYLDRKPFEREGIKLAFQEFECLSYPQLYPEMGFIPELSIVDLLFNCGSESLKILLEGSPSRVSG